MNFSVLDEFDFWTVADGKVFLQPFDGGAIHARVGEQTFAFEKFDPSKHEMVQSSLVFRDKGNGTGFVPKSGQIKVKKNIAPEWTLSGKTTYYFIVADTQKSLKILYQQNGSEFVQIRNQAYQFQGLFAAHRAVARVKLSVFDKNKHELNSWTEAFDSSSPGGTERHKYKNISFHIAADPRVVFLSFCIEYVHAKEGEAEGLPFVFFTECSLRPANQTEKKAPEALRGGNIRQNALDSLGVCTISPYAFSGDEMDLELVKEDEVVTIHEVPVTKIGLKYENDGYLHFTSSLKNKYSLYIDGQFQTEAHIDKERVSLPIDVKFMDGQSHHIMVRDQLGMACLFEDFQIFPYILTPYEVLQRETRAPYPSFLSTAARFRYEALQAQIGKAAAGEDVNLKQLVYAHGVLEAGFETLKKFEPLVFDQPEEPDVSIVIPVHNKFAITYYCLCALLVAANDLSFEVIVVDDGSSDETIDMDELVTGVTVLHNEEPQRFIRACNKGADAAKGKYIVLLNNDTEPTAGWLDELVSAFNRFDGAGLVGSKLLYPDGSLQDGGGIIWSSGNPWNYGRDANPWDPRFCYARQADYLSGAAMLTSREIWDQVGGLSDYLEPMYFEDTDFSFKVREAGYKTYYVPQSIIFHFEGKSSGTDVTKGMKRFQEVNRPKFKRRWASAFRLFGEEGVKPDLEKDRGIVGRVAFLDYTTPRPDRDAGSYAAIQEIKLVQSLGFKVTFIPQNLAYLGDYSEELQRMGVEVISAPFFSSVNQFIEQRGEEFDAFFITRYQVAKRHIETIRKQAPKTKILFNNADLHFLRMLRTGIARKDSALIRDSISVRDEELLVVRSADVTLSYNEVEHSVIASHVLDQAKIVKCPWVVETQEDIPAFGQREGISFLGGYLHHPNVEGVEYFVRNVSPLLERSLPKVVFSIYGSAMPDSMKKLESATVDPVGFAQDLFDVYGKHRVFVAPLLSGAGIKGKVLSALAYGIPCVLSPAAAEGIGVRDGYDCLIAEKPEEWVEAIKSLYTDKKLWTTLSENSRALVSKQYSFETGQKLMKSAFEEAGIFLG